MSCTMNDSRMKVLGQCLGFFFQPLDRDEPTGRPQWRFTVFAQDDGGNGLVGYADVQVNLKDINDNAPLFPQGVYYGNVTENGTAGESVTRSSILQVLQSDEGRYSSHSICHHFRRYVWVVLVKF